MKRGPLRIATRRSALALWQAEFISAALRAAHPGLEVELVPITTQGDRWLAAPLSEVGGKGLFIKELEQAMLEGTADVAVHSMKDVPADLPDEFVVGAIGFRDDVRDVLVSRDGALFDQLPAGSRIGSASLRRAAQLRRARDDLSIEPIRGNVNTRLDKLDAGTFDALILASAGLNRLGLADRVTQYLDVGLSLPAAGQGALGVECPAARYDLVELLQPLNDPNVAACVRAERSVSLGLGADCSMPVAAYAECTDTELWLRGLVARADGGRVVAAATRGTDPEDVGAEVAGALRDQGALDLLVDLSVDPPVDDGD